MGVASLILGIASILTGPGGTIFAIVGLILGTLAKKKDPANPGVAKPGVILPIIGLIISIIWWVGCIACTIAAGSSGYYY